MPSLLEVAAEHEGRGPGGTCAIALLLARLSPSEIAEYKIPAGLASSFTSKRIAEGFAKLGHPISSYTIARHRRGDCQCPRS